MNEPQKYYTYYERKEARKKGLILYNSTYMNYIEQVNSERQQIGRCQVRGGQG